MKLALTPWFPPEIPPTIIGEYLASIFMQDGLKRWWHGDAWSIFYRDSDTEEFKELSRNTLSVNCQNCYWRGLANKPDEIT